MAKASGGKLTLEMVDPDETPRMRQELFKRYGIRPLAISMFSEQSFYLTC